METPELLQAKLRDAALTGDLQIVTSLIDNGVDTRTKDPKVCTMCFTASLLCRLWTFTLSIHPLTLRPACMSYALACFASASFICEQDGQTALSNACAYGHIEILKLLLASAKDFKEQDVEAKNDNGNTPLMLAAQYGQVDCAKLLVAEGATLHAKNNKGQTALDMAYAQEGNPGTLEVAIFLELKQDVRARLANITVKQRGSGNRLNLGEGAESEAGLFNACTRRFPLTAMLACAPRLIVFLLFSTHRS